MENKSKKKAITIFIYNSYSDPLFKGNLLVILKHIASLGYFSFYIITYEQIKYKLTKKEQQQEQIKLRLLDVYWIPLIYHSGKFILFKKFFDLLVGFGVILKFKLLKGSQTVISLGTVSGSFTFLISRLLRLKQYAYQHEPHSEFMLDFGIWSKNSFSYKILNIIESWTSKYAEVISTGTDAMIDRLRKMKARGYIYKFPSCVEDKQFVFHETKRQEIRSKYQIEDRYVVLYLGKFGGIYYDEEIIKLCSTLKGLNSKFYFLIVTPDDSALIKNKMISEGIAEKDFMITYSSYEEVPYYISASDFGVVAVPGHPSQKYRSPIKVGEYLCCGLPYLVCEGVSEDYIIAKKYNVGVTIKSFTNEEITKKYEEIIKLIIEERRQKIERCRIAGIEYRGLSKWIKESEKIFHNLQY